MRIENRDFKIWQEKGLVPGEIDISDTGDAFDGMLSFGTSGLRGIMGIGTNRINIYTVRQATQGLSDFLLEKIKKPSVIISYDSRKNSRLFAEKAAGVLTGNGIKTYIFREMMPVPVLSYSIRRLGCDAGIMITASHNPKEYNGYKVYAASGGQILKADAEAITYSISKTDIFDGIKEVDFEEVLKQGCSYVDDDIFENYIKEVKRAAEFTPERDVRIIYTPLNGSGRRPVARVMKEFGFEIFTVPEQENENGNFPTCPSPNPEMKEVYEVALGYAKQKNADIIIATDPDCDRMGVMVRYDHGYRLLSGNEIGILMINYMCEVTDVSGKYMITSIVSTPFAEKIAKSAGVNTIETFVGFKYIGDVMEHLNGDFLFAFEESNGYLAGNYARDKDGVLAAVIIAQMTAYYADRAKSLVDVLDDIYKKYGICLDETVNIIIRDKIQRQAFMEKVTTKEKFAEIFGKVDSFIDYSKDQTGLEAEQMIKAELGGIRIIIRPSGTEPKIKFYLSVFDDDRRAAERKIKWLKSKINNLFD